MSNVATVCVWLCVFTDINVLAYILSSIKKKYIFFLTDHNEMMFGVLIIKSPRRFVSVQIIGHQNIYIIIILYNYIIIILFFMSIRPRLH